MTNANGLANSFVLDGAGTYTLTVNNIAADGYTFDPESSMLTKSITTP
jgi:hypothetical protein